uniref:Uncharacterized protein n=1 Tax=Kalanchoe fedtschenkoi TaxID=63787 RepID=A0A7N0UYT8_KALFE
MSFIDLDMRRLEKMEHYYELDQGIVGWYNQMIHDQESNHSKGAKLCKSRVDAEEIAMTSTLPRITASDRRLNSQASAQIFHSA